MDRGSRVGDAINSIISGAQGLADVFTSGNLFHDIKREDIRLGDHLYIYSSDYIISHHGIVVMVRNQVPGSMAPSRRTEAVAQPALNHESSVSSAGSAMQFAQKRKDGPGLNELEDDTWNWQNPKIISQHEEEVDGDEFHWPPINAGEGPASEADIQAAASAAKKQHGTFLYAGQSKKKADSPPKKETDLPIVSRSRSPRPRSEKSKPHNPLSERLNSDDIWVIHFHADATREDQWAKRHIHLTTLSTFGTAFSGEQHALHICRYGVPPIEYNMKRAGTCSTLEADPYYLSVLRAITMLDTGDGQRIAYHVIRKNCELFCSWCKLGHRCGIRDFRTESAPSLQSDPYRMGILAAGGAVAVGALAVGAMAATETAALAGVAAAATSSLRGAATNAAASAANNPEAVQENIQTGVARLRVLGLLNPSTPEERRNPNADQPGTEGNPSPWQQNGPIQSDEDTLVLSAMPSSSNRGSASDPIDVDDIGITTEVDDHHDLTLMIQEILCRLFTEMQVLDGVIPPPMKVLLDSPKMCVGFCDVILDTLQLETQAHEVEFGTIEERDTYRMHSILSALMQSAVY